MSGRFVLACAVLAFGLGGLAGWSAAMHTRVGRAYMAIAQTYLAQKRWIDTQTDLAMAEVARHRQEIGRSAMNTVRHRAKEMKHGK